MEWRLRARPGIATYVGPALSSRPGATFFLDQRRKKDVFPFHNGRRRGRIGRIRGRVRFVIKEQLNQHARHKHVNRVGSGECTREQNRHEDRFEDCLGKCYVESPGERHRDDQSGRYGDACATNSHPGTTHSDAGATDSHSRASNPDAGTCQPEQRERRRGWDTIRARGSQHLSRRLGYLDLGFVYPTQRGRRRI